MIEITNNNINDEFKNAVIDFYSPTCMPCRKMMPVLKELEKDYKNISFYKVNAVENPEFVNKFQVQGLPTIIVLKDGIVKEKFVGLQSKSKIKEVLGE